MELKDIQRERLEQYLTAERAILQGQSYVIGDRSLTRADLKYVQSMITDLMVEMSTTENRRGMTKRAVFYD